MQDLVAQIKAAEVGKNSNKGTETKLLIPINLNNQHWVGISVEFVDGKLKVIYMDSERTAMPELLKTGLKAGLPKIYPNIVIEVEEKEVTKQETNDCGLQVIENLIEEVAGEAAKIPPELALKAHTIFYVQGLLEEVWRAGEKSPESKAPVQNILGITMLELLEKVVSESAKLAGSSRTETKRPVELTRTTDLQETYGNTNTNYQTLKEQCEELINEMAGRNADLIPDLN